MTTVVFNRAFNLETIDFADFLDGNVDFFGSSSTMIHVFDGKYDAYIGGENFDPFSLTGTIHSVRAQVNDHDLFTATDLNVDLGEAWAARNDDAALKEIFFGGNDSFIGSRLGDTIAGFDGADRIKGGKGDDHLTGGAGGDVMSGGLGADTFVYTDAGDSVKGAVDRIFDLNDAEDSIDLTALNVNKAPKVTYNEITDVTTFGVYIAGDGHAGVDMIITARGDHTDFVF